MPNENENEQHFFIPLEAELDLSQDDALVPLESPKLHFNDQMAESGLIANSFTYEEKGFIAGRNLYQFRTFIDGLATTDYVDRYGRPGRVTRIGNIIQVLDQLDNCIAAFIWNDYADVREGEIVSWEPDFVHVIYNDVRYPYIKITGTCKNNSEYHDFHITVDMETLQILPDLSEYAPQFYKASVSFLNTEQILAQVKRLPTGRDILTYDPAHCAGDYDVFSSKYHVSGGLNSLSYHFPGFGAAGVDGVLNLSRNASTGKVQYDSHTIANFTVTSPQALTDDIIEARGTDTEVSNVQFRFSGGRTFPYSYGSYAQASIVDTGCPRNATSDISVGYVDSTRAYVKFRYWDMDTGGQSSLQYYAFPLPTVSASGFANLSDWVGTSTLNIMSGNIVIMSVAMKATARYNGNGTCTFRYEATSFNSGYSCGFVLTVIFNMSIRYEYSAVEVSIPAARRLSGWRVSDAQIVTNRTSTALPTQLDVLFDVWRGDSVSHMRLRYTNLAAMQTSSNGTVTREGGEGAFNCAFSAHVSAVNTDSNKSLVVVKALHDTATRLFQASMHSISGVGAVSDAVFRTFDTSANKEIQIATDAGDAVLALRSWGWEFSSDSYYTYSYITPSGASYDTYAYQTAPVGTLIDTKRAQVFSGYRIETIAREITSGTVWHRFSVGDYITLTYYKEFTTTLPNGQVVTAYAIVPWGETPAVFQVSSVRSDGQITGFTAINRGIYTYEQRATYSKNWILSVCDATGQRPVEPGKQYDEDINSVGVKVTLTFGSISLTGTGSGYTVGQKFNVADIVDNMVITPAELEVAAIDIIGGVEQLRLTAQGRYFSPVEGAVQLTTGTDRFPATLPPSTKYVYETVRTAATATMYNLAKKVNFDATLGMKGLSDKWYKETYLARYLIISSLGSGYDPKYTSRYAVFEDPVYFPGAGYAVGDVLEVSTHPTSTMYRPKIKVVSVTENGGIVDYSIVDPGTFNNLGPDRYQAPVVKDGVEQPDRGVLWYSLAQGTPPGWNIQTFYWHDDRGSYFVRVDLDADLRCVCDISDVLVNRGSITIEDKSFNDTMMLDEPVNVNDIPVLASSMEEDRIAEDHRFYALTQTSRMEANNHSMRLISVSVDEETGAEEVAYIAGESLEDVFYISPEYSLVQWGVSSNVSMEGAPQLWGVYVNEYAPSKFYVYYTPAVVTEGPYAGLGVTNLNYKRVREWNESSRGYQYNWDAIGSVTGGLSVWRNGKPVTSQGITYYGPEMRAYDIVARAVISATWAQGMFMMGIKLTRGINQWTLRGGQVCTGFGSVGPTGIITGNWLPVQSVLDVNGFYETPVEGKGAYGANNVFLDGSDLMFYYQTVTGYCYGLDDNGNIMEVPMSSQMDVMERRDRKPVEGDMFTVSFGVGRLIGVWGYTGLFHWANVWLTGSRKGEQVLHSNDNYTLDVTVKQDPLAASIMAMTGALMDTATDHFVAAIKDDLEIHRDAPLIPSLINDSRFSKKRLTPPPVTPGQASADETSSEEDSTPIAVPRASPIRFGDLMRTASGGSKTMSIKISAEIDLVNDNVPACFNDQQVYSVPGAYFVQAVRTARRQISYQWMKAACANAVALNPAFLIAKLAAVGVSAIPGFTAGANPGPIVGFAPPQGLGESISNAADAIPKTFVTDYGPITRNEAYEEDIPFAGNQHVYLSGPLGERHSAQFDESVQTLRCDVVNEQLGPGVGSTNAQRLDFEMTIDNRRLNVDLDGSVIIGSESMLGKEGLTRTAQPVFSAPGIYEALVEPVYKVWVAASGDDVIHISIDDTKVIDGPFTNMVIDRDMICIASTYNVVTAMKGGNINLLKPQALTEGLRLNKTGNNYIEGPNWVHAFDGYGNRITSWVGAGGSDVEVLQQVSQYLPNKLKRTLHTVFPPTTYFGAFTNPPATLYKHRVNLEVINDNTKQRWIEQGTKEDTAVTRLSFPVFYRRVSNLPAGIQTIGTYKLFVVNGLTSLTTDARTSSIRNITTAKDVMIYGRTYRGFNEYLSAVNQQYGILALTNVSVITGYKILGADTKSILMFNTSSGQMAMFKGSEILEKAYKVRRIKDFDDAVYEFIQQELIATGTMALPLQEKAIVRFDELKAVGMVPNPRKELQIIDTYAGPVGFVMQGKRRATAHFPLFHDNMHTIGINQNRGKWGKIKGDTIGDFFSLREYDEMNPPTGYSWAPWRLATAFHGLDDSVDCLFEYVLTFAFTDWMYSIIGDRYVTVNIAAEMATLGGHMESEVTHLRLRSDMFHRTGSKIGYYSYRYNARNGAGNRERLFIWSDDIISMRPIEVIVRPITTARTSPLLTAPDFEGVEEF